MIIKVFYIYNGKFFPFLFQIGIDMAFFPDIQNDLEFVELMVTEESVFCLPGKVIQIITQN